MTFYFPALKPSSHCILGIQATQAQRDLSLSLRPTAKAYYSSRLKAH